MPGSSSSWVFEHTWWSHTPILSVPAQVGSSESPSSSSSWESSILVESKKPYMAEIKLSAMVLLPPASSTSSLWPSHPWDPIQWGCQSSFLLLGAASGPLPPSWVESIPQRHQLEMPHFSQPPLLLPSCSFGPTSQRQPLLFSSPVFWSLFLSARQTGLLLASCPTSSSSLARTLRVPLEWNPPSLPKPHYLDSNADSPSALQGILLLPSASSFAPSWPTAEPS